MAKLALVLGAFGNHRGQIPLRVAGRQQVNSANICGVFQYARDAVLSVGQCVCRRLTARLSVVLAGQAYWRDGLQPPQATDAHGRQPGAARPAGECLAFDALSLRIRAPHTEPCDREADPGGAAVAVSHSARAPQGVAAAGREVRLS